jgi:hypothetical protein
VEFLRGFCPVRHRNDIFLKRQFLENRVSITDIRNGLKFTQFTYKHLKITKIALSIEPPTAHRTLLYIHGGSFCLGSAETYQEFCSELTKVRFRVHIEQQHQTNKQTHPLFLYSVPLLFSFSLFNA